MANVYYVDKTTGDDSDTGLTEALAWETINKVNTSSFSAGDTIKFKKGETWRESLTVPSSGSSGSPIAFGTYGSGADPIITGFNLISTWSAKALEDSGGVFSSGFEDEVDAMTTDFDGKTEAGSNTITIGTTPTYGGADNATCAFDGTNRDCYAYKAFAQQADIYVRAYIRRNASSDCTSTYSYWPVLVLRDASTRSVMHLHARAGSPSATWGWYCTIDDKNGAATAIYTSASDFAVDTWYRVEMRYKVDGSVGGGQLWIDGVSKGSNFTKDTTGQDVDTVRVGGNSEDAWSGVPTSGSEIYIEDVKVDSSAIGAAVVYKPNTWGATCTTEPEHIYLDGTLGSEASAWYDLNASNEWVWSSNELFVYSTTDPDTAYTSPGIEASIRNFSVQIAAKNYITVDGLEVSGNRYYGLYLNGAAGDVTNIIVQNFKSTKNYINGFHGNASTNSITNITIDSNEFSYNGANGVRIGDNSNTYTVSNNTFHHNSTIYTVAGAHSSTGGLRTNATTPATCHTITVENNEAYNNGDNQPGGVYTGKGIWFDSTGANMIARYNKCYDNHSMGIFVENQDSSQIYYNLCYGNTGHGISLRAGSDSNAIYNNVCYNNDIGIEVNGVAGAGSGAQNNLVKNNISIGNSGCELSAKNGGENPSGDGNVYTYNCFDAEAANFIEWGDGVYKSTYDAWETAYGGSTYSVEADPLMTDPSNDDFTLQTTSPCKNAGTDVSLTRDYAGNSVPSWGTFPDVGAYELQMAIGGGGVKMTMGMGMT